MPPADRYTSGTSLDRTQKEMTLDSIERAFAVAFTDELYHDLKKLKLKSLKELLESLRYVR